MRRRNIYGVAFVFWMVFITVLSLVSFDDDTSLDIDIPNFDKIVHLVFYFVAGILAGVYFRSLKTATGNLSVLMIKILFGLIAYGIIIEVLQGILTTYRSAELMDVLANSTGSLLGIALLWLVYSRRTVSN